MMLLNTSGLFAYHHRDEPEHETARTMFRASGKKLTHSYVLAELVALGSARKAPRLPLLSFLAILLEHPLVEVVWVGEALHQEAMALLDSRPDKSYSLCDAVSFVLMREHGITEALTTDHHFEQEGLRRLLLP